MCNDHSCQYCTIHIVSCVKSFVSYQHIISAHKSYNTVCVSYELHRIVRYIDKYFKIRFFLLKFVLLFESKKLLDLFLTQND